MKKANFFGNTYDFKYLFLVTRPNCHHCSLETKAFLFPSSLARLTLLSYFEN